ncbi:MAG: ABC transporter permease [Firmicutes bacterium]|nr:ABC transporter permease [Bacillota bacterium]
MRRSFFFRLAISNIQRNKRLNVPFFAASSIMAAVYFLVIALLYTDGIANIPGGQGIRDVFAIGRIIMGMIVVIFMFYINSFLLKNRKKEFGLYGVLGLEKHHVGRVIFCENLLVFAGALLLGMLAGAVFGRLIFMLLLFVLKTAAAGSIFRLPAEAFLHTGTLFGIVFILITFYNQFQIRLANPVDLLKGEQVGEARVRFAVPATLLGLAMLCFAYWKALTVDSSITALNDFFRAVILVIPATVILFITGSNLLLNSLKKNKRFYYRPGNFIAVSGLIYRMKQNAAGLAVICILSSMVLVTVSGTTALFFGQEDILSKRFPNDIKITLEAEITPEQARELALLADTLASEHGVTIEDRYAYNHVPHAADVLILKDGRFSPVDFRSWEEYAEKYQHLEQYMYDVFYLTLAEFNRVAGRAESLSAGKILLATNEKLQPVPANVKSIIAGTKLTTGKNGNPHRTIFTVAADEAAVRKLYTEFNPDSHEITSAGTMILNVAGENEKLLAFARAFLNRARNVDKVMSAYSIFTDRVEGYGIFGGLLFLGAFFTIIFLTITVLIIYFKQISEGLDDAGRFAILQKVGMDDLAVKHTINRQIMIVFFLPLLGALLHILFAGKMIVKMLEAFSFYNVPLTVLCITLSVLVFAAIYVFVYRVTAKVYYNLVKW